MPSASTTASACEAEHSVQSLMLYILAYISHCAAHTYRVRNIIFKHPHLHPPHHRGTDASRSSKEQADNGTEDDSLVTSSNEQQAKRAAEDLALSKLSKPAAYAKAAPPSNYPAQFSAKRSFDLQLQQQQRLTRLLLTGISIPSPSGSFTELSRVYSGPDERSSNNAEQSESSPRARPHIHPKRNMKRGLTNSLPQLKLDHRISLDCTTDATSPTTKFSRASEDLPRSRVPNSNRLHTLMRASQQPSPTANPKTTPLPLLPLCASSPPRSGVSFTQSSNSLRANKMFAPYLLSGGAACIPTSASGSATQSPRNSQSRESLMKGLSAYPCPLSALANLRQPSISSGPQAACKKSKPSKSMPSHAFKDAVRKGGEAAPDIRRRSGENMQDL